MTVDDFMKPPLDELAHYGILGMRWGRRKSQSTSDIQVKTKDISVKADGSMSIEKGASLQRLVRSNGQSLPLKDLSYASLTNFDNAKYIKYIGGKGFFGGGRDTVLKLTAVQKIKAPSMDEATKIINDLFLNDSKFRNTFTNMMGDKISDKELKTISKDPTGKTAKAWYTSVNTSLTFSPDFDAASPYVQKTVRETFQKKGFNAVRDENDYQTGVSKAPIILFSPEKTVKITTVSTITDELRKKSSDELNQYKQLGKNWVEEQLYE